MRRGAAVLELLTRGNLAVFLFALVIYVVGEASAREMIYAVGKINALR